MPDSCEQRAGTAIVYFGDETQHMTIAVEHNGSRVYSNQTETGGTDAVGEVIEDGIAPAGARGITLELPNAQNYQKGTNE
jgi:hypothetical protein